MTPEAMETLHARAFAGQGRGWSMAEFGDLLKSPLVFETSVPGGFSLGRVVVDEAELLTIATDPDHRRQGIAHRVLLGFETEATRRGATSAFLEVAADNAAALGLYQQSGYAEISRRVDYYLTPDGRKSDALVLQKPLI